MNPRTITLAVLLSLLASAPFSGAQAPVDLTALKAQGATLTETAGVPTKLELRDCTNLTEADLKTIGRLTTLKALTLYRCKALNDTTLPLLAGLTQLQDLSTDSIQVTDEGLKHFTQFKSLRGASFFHPSFGMKGFTGKGFVHFKELPNLEKLTIAGTPFNDEGMNAIAQITQLKEFNTWHTYQTPAGTPLLEKLPDLKKLNFGQRLRKWDGKPNPLTLDDAALEAIAKFPALETLQLGEARLTYAGLSKLKALTKLKTLSIDRVLIDPADIEKLKADLPNVKITFKPVAPADTEKLEAALK